MCVFSFFFLFFFFFKQKTAYEMCGRDWSSDVCSSDLSNEQLRAKSTEHEIQRKLASYTAITNLCIPGICIIFSVDRE